MTPQVRKIDRWFPIDAVDEACGNPAGSGRSEKALMTWFASRPIAQARAAVITALLPDVNDETQRLIDVAVRGRDVAAESGASKTAVSFEDAVQRVTDLIHEQYQQPPVVLDPFSGRGIIPLEAARFGVRAVGTDLSPLATLGGRLLADYPYRDWSGEPELPDGWGDKESRLFEADDTPRLLKDVGAVLDEVGRRLASEAEPAYPRNPDGTYPWGYLWAVTITCDGCKRRFPLLGSLMLRHPRTKTSDPGQHLRITTSGDECHVHVDDGTTDVDPPFMTLPGTRRKVGKCVFCGHSHSRDSLKRKGFGGDYRDRLICVGEYDSNATPMWTFREPRSDELDAADGTPLDVEGPGNLAPVPDEVIPAGNNDTVRASGYGYSTYGALMTPRQAKQFALTSRIIRDVHGDLRQHGLSEDYAAALAGYAGATMVRRIKYATRGSTLRSHGSVRGAGSNRVQTDHIYSGESKVADGFDYFETGPGEGPATWPSIGATALNALRAVSDWPSERAQAGRFRPSSATSLPLADGSVDLIVTDPPYYNMIDYSDASDLLYVWVRRALYDAMPDLFGPDAPDLQNKTDEIIVKRGGTEGEHRTKDWYHGQLSAAFGEMKRVLKSDGHLTVVFGHHDPDAWVRLLGALRDAGFVVTSSWPSRTEAGSTGVASIKVTVSIGCRVAPDGRPDGLMNQVDLEIRNEVASRVKRWTDDGLALPDQLMAAYGPAMEVYGRYENVLQPNGEPVDLERYLLLARAVVKDTVAMKVDELPLETFDAETRLAIAWLRFYGHTVVQKGEARFMAQTEAIRIDDVRDLFVESKNGFKLNTEPTDVGVTEKTPVFGLVLAMCARMAGDTEGDLVGVDGAASVLAAAETTGAVSKTTDPHLWAVVSELHQKLPDSSKTGKALARIVRSRQQIVNAADRGHSKVAQQVDRDLAQQTLDLTGDEA